MWRALWLWVWTAGAAAAGSALPAFFVANRGEAPAGVRYVWKGPGFAAYLAEYGVVLRARGGELDVRFEGADEGTTLEAEQPLAGRVNFLIGSADRWRRDVPTFAAVRYRGLYPGIEVVYRAAGGYLKSDYVVAPGADPRRIRIRYRGGGTPFVEEGGGLGIPFGEEMLRESAPYVYQEKNGARIVVESRYVLLGGGLVAFEVGAYDRGRPLEIDPALVYCTLVGNAGFNAATAIAVDSAGAVYLAGYTDSTNLPTANPAQNFNGGSVNAFVVKLNPAGTSLEYCTYIGGSEDDQAFGIAVSAEGAAVVVGTATSADFPVIRPWQGSLEGSRNAFVFKLNPVGDMLVFSTYLGGNGADTANGVAIDPAGDLYVVGDTTSTNFPATAFQTSNQGSQDAFVAKLTGNGSQLVLSTYLGGSGYDHGAAIAVDSAGTMYVTGSTWSANFPVANAFQPANGGYSNAFITHLASDGNTLVFSTYLGGNGGQMGYPETGQGIALDAAGDAYVAGVTSSSNFPLWNALQTQLNGFTDAFVTKVTAAGTMLFSTYMGGSGVDVGNAVALDASGSVYVAGYTYSTDFPVTTAAIQAELGGGCDAFLFKLSPAGDALLYATYLGGTGNDTASGVAVDSAGNVYFAGWTMSANFPAMAKN